MLQARLSSTLAVAAKHELVVLMHGFSGHRVQMLPLASSLSREFKVLNYGYKSRSQKLQEHSRSLVDAIDTRVKHDAPKHVHFVSHSFGGVLLCSAFKEGLAEVLPHGTRCALIAPPLRGAVLARTLEEMDFRGPDVVRRAVRAMARAFTGPSSGMELRTCGPAWFEATGHIPNDIPVLVVEGAPGHVNPMIRGESDFVVGSDETQLNRPHRRLRVGLTHNLLLMSPTVLGDVRKFVRGEEVGFLDEGKTMECP